VTISSERNHHRNGPGRRRRIFDPRGIKLFCAEDHYNANWISLSPCKPKSCKLHVTGRNKAQEGHQAHVKDSKCKATGGICIKELVVAKVCEEKLPRCIQMIIGRWQLGWVERFAIALVRLAPLCVYSMYLLQHHMCALPRCCSTPTSLHWQQVHGQEQIQMLMRWCSDALAIEPCPTKVGTMEG